ncbi:MAG: site-2 protease family protein [Saccharofermentans sp.]|nr:site-2 protease family protein [Saccharofermentans sp.]
MLVEILKGNYTGRELLFIVLVTLFALTLSFSIHEFMHAAVATWLGDDTPGYMGRLTLNPGAHLDPVGTLCILLLGFGWGKPVVFNPNKLTRFKSKRLMRILVSLAGVFGNFLLALIASIIMTIVGAKIGFNVFNTSNGLSMMLVLVYLHQFSLGLLAFNLLIIPPLDGFHVLEELIPIKFKYSDLWKGFCTIGPRVLTVLILVGSMTGVHVLSYIVVWIEMPFEFIIQLICNLLWSIL